MEEPTTKRHTRSGSQQRQRSKLAGMACTKDEYKQLAEAAERAGLSMSAFMRVQCLGKAGPRAARRPPVERAGLAQIVGHLGKSGGNVNQIARALNTRRDDWPEDLVKMIAELREIGMDTVMGELRAASAAIFHALGRTAP